MRVDAHLDVAWNALSQGHGFLGRLADGYIINRATLAEARVGLFFGSIFCAPEFASKMLGTRLVYRTAAEARLMAMAELGYYAGLGLRVIGTGAELADYQRRWQPGELAIVLQMEGADPIVRVSELGWWRREGLRIVGPSWGPTRFSGGTSLAGSSTGGLTRSGQELLSGMWRHHMILDVSHMSDRGVQESLALWRGPVIASHSNVRSLTPGARQLSDGSALEIGRRDGVIGISLYRGHLTRAATATLQDVLEHVLYLARLLGGHENIGLGTDLDGGFSSQDAAIKSTAELDDLEQLLLKHFNREAVDGIMGGNWLRFLRSALPSR